MRTWRDKIIDSADSLRAKLYNNHPGALFVLTNGCFDLLHIGHVEFLEAAKQEAVLLDSRLVVGINSDASVQALKGNSRPVVSAWERAAVIASLEAVDYCIIFNETRCAGLIRSIQPLLWIKGGDYTIETLDPGERKAAESVNTKIKIIPYVKGHSSSDLIARCQAAAAGDRRP